MRTPHRRAADYLRAILSPITRCPAGTKRWYAPNASQPSCSPASTTTRIGAWSRRSPPGGCSRRLRRVQQHPRPRTYTRRARQQITAAARFLAWLPERPAEHHSRLREATQADVDAWLAGGPPDLPGPGLPGPGQRTRARPAVARVPARAQPRRHHPRRRPLRPARPAVPHDPDRITAITTDQISHRDQQVFLRWGPPRRAHPRARGHPTVHAGPRPAPPPRRRYPRPPAAGCSPACYPPARSPPPGSASACARSGSTPSPPAGPPPSHSPPSYPPRSSPSAAPAPDYRRLLGPRRRRRLEPPRRPTRPGPRSPTMTNANHPLRDSGRHSPGSNTAGYQFRCRSASTRPPNHRRPWVPDDHPTIPTPRPAHRDCSRHRPHRIPPRAAVPSPRRCRSCGEPQPTSLAHEPISVFPARDADGRCLRPEDTTHRACRDDRI